MSVAYKILQQHPGGNHSALIVTDLTSQSRLGVAYWDTARGQFAFSPDNPDLVLSAADQASLVTILNGLSR